MDFFAGFLVGYFVHKDVSAKDGYIRRYASSAYHYAKSIFLELKYYMEDRYK